MLKIYNKNLIRIYLTLITILFLSCAQEKNHYASYTKDNPSDRFQMGSLGVPTFNNQIMKSNYRSLDGLLNDPWVIKESSPSDLYIMYYGAMKGDFSDKQIRIFCATSKDGYNWVKNSIPVLLPGPIGSWDSAKVETPSVVKLPGGSYRMYYSGGNDPNTEVLKIGMATSPDGITWQKYPGNPVLSQGPRGSFDEISVIEPSVLYKDNEYWMWYAGISKAQKVEIGFAKSKDGISWERKGYVLKLDIEREQSDDIGLTEQHVIWNGKSFEMLYAVLQKKGKLLGPIWHAISLDGINWEKDKKPVLKRGDKTHWTGQGIQSPSFLLEKGKYRIWYGGTHTDGKTFLELSIGLLELNQF